MTLRQLTQDTVFPRQNLRLWLGIGLITLLGAVLRLYHLGAQKLWLDELYTVQLVQGGLPALWMNGFVDSMPFLANAFFWVAAQIGGTSAVTLRLVSALAAIATVPLFYLAAKQATDQPTATLAAGLLAIAPLAVYYAQEARPYALPLLALVLTQLAYERVRRQDRWPNWLLYAMLAGFAGQTQYINIVLVGAQLLALFILTPRRWALLPKLIVVAAVMCLVTLTPFVVAMLTAGNVIGTKQAAPVVPLEIISSLQTILAGDTRFASDTIRWLMLVIILTGSVIGLGRIIKTLGMLPYVLQIVLLLSIVFVLLPIFGYVSPSYRDRVFILLLPAIFLCFSAGIRQLMAWNWLKPLAATLVLTLIVMSFSSLWTYFTKFNKSPEALVAEQLKAQAQPGDIAISDCASYSADAALRYYAPDIPIYSCRGERSFSPDASILVGRYNDGQRVDLAQLQTYPRIWLIQRTVPDEAFVGLLEADQRVQRAAFEVAPFRIRLLERDQP